MATPLQTAQMIRLALGSLAAANEHHSFEHLCRQVAKRRIASNVLPATGPVPAGGDQGRDFETFRTYLADELPFAIGFLALASSDFVVFACTIQREKLRTKFEGDIKSICIQGTHVDRICIFATENVPTRAVVVGDDACDADRVPGRVVFMVEGDRRAVAASMNQVLFGPGSAAMAPNSTRPSQGG